MLTQEPSIHKTEVSSPKTPSMPWDFLPSAETLENWAENFAEKYQKNSPYPHIVLDGFLKTPAAEKLANCFPGPQEDFWVRTRINDEIKSASTNEGRFPEAIRSALYALNSAPVIQFLETLTGISGLLPDPFFQGGGIHQTLPGGKLGVHVDFNQLPKSHLYRRLNLLIYLNPDWQESYGGHLELWDPAGEKCQKKVSPLFNRCVIFTTTATSFHGHPIPLTCPPERTRNSLALYYYTALPPEGKKSFVHGTVFMDTSSDRKSILKKIRRMVSLCCPPILLKGLKGLAAQMGIDR